MTLEAIFDSYFAKQLIATTKANNEEILQQAKGVGSFSRIKWLKQHDYKPLVNILTDTALKKELLGEGEITPQYTSHIPGC